MSDDDQKDVWIGAPAADAGDEPSEAPEEDEGDE